MDLAYTVSSTYYYTGGLALKEVNFAQAEPLASDSRVDRVSMLSCAWCSLREPDPGTLYSL